MRLAALALAFVSMYCLLADGADQPLVINQQHLARQVELDDAQPPAYLLSEGSFSLASDVRDDPQVECRWATARTSDGRAAPRAQDLVVYFHQPGNIEFQRDPLFRALVERCGFTVCGVRFPNSSAPPLFPDRDRFYSFSRSGSFTTIRRALAMLREQLALPPTPVYLFGYSAGGIGVQRFAEEYPELCGGVVSYCGHSFVQKNKARCPFLIVHNFGDGAENGVGLETYYRSLGNPVIRLVIPPAWHLVKLHGVDACHHYHRPWIDRLVASYFMALADQRRASPAVPWPLTVLARDHRTLIADGIAIPQEEQTIMVPSMPFYGELLQAPPEPITATLLDGRAISLAAPAQAQHARGMLIMRVLEAPHDADSYLSASPRNVALRYGASRGFVTVTYSGDRISEADLRRLTEIAGATVVGLPSGPATATDIPEHLNVSNPGEMKALLESLNGMITSITPPARP